MERKEFLLLQKRNLLLWFVRTYVHTCYSIRINKKKRRINTYLIINNHNIIIILAHKFAIVVKKKTKNDLSNFFLYITQRFCDNNKTKICKCNNKPLIILPTYL